MPLACVAATRRTLVAAPLLALVTSASATAQTLTQDEALALAFPGATVQRRTAFLDEGQIERVAALAADGAAGAASVVPYYVAVRDGEEIGVAYFDAHRVRTLDEVLMVVIGPDGRVRRVETVAFREPPEYRAPDGWLRLFDGEDGDGPSVFDGVPDITGATLTSGAVKRAVRLVLAIHRVLAPLDGGTSP